VQWEYRKILLNEHRRREDDLDLLCDAGERGWELVAITPNNVAYLKREVLRTEMREEPDQRKQVDYPAGVKPKYRDPATGETWSGRGRMAMWLKQKQDAGENIEKYRVKTGE
jgi:H-NS histone family